MRSTRMLDQTAAPCLSSKQDKYLKFALLRFKAISSDLQYSHQCGIFRLNFDSTHKSIQLLIRTQGHCS